jgi:hypothetical protein
MPIGVIGIARVRLGENVNPKNEMPLKAGFA